MDGTEEGMGWIGAIRFVEMITVLSFIPFSGDPDS
jgi:hypothetical protein